MPSALCLHLFLALPFAHCPLPSALCTLHSAYTFLWLPHGPYALCAL